MKLSYLVAAVSAVVVSAFAVAAPPAPGSFHINLLAAAPGQTGAFVTGINSSHLASGNIWDENGIDQPAYWDASGAIHLLPNLGTGPDGGFGDANDVNDAGLIVGTTSNSAGILTAVVWKNGVPTALGNLFGDTSSRADGINSAGVIVGGSSSYAGQHAVLFSPGGVGGDYTLTDYGTADLGDPKTRASWRAISDNGHLAGTGFQFLHPNYAITGELGDVFSMKKLGITGPSTSNSEVTAINSAGLAVGFQNRNGFGPGQPVTFNADGSVNFIVPDDLGLTEGRCLDVNAAGDIVGRCWGSDPDSGDPLSKAFLYRDGQAYDLLTLLDNPAGWDRLLEATAISDDGTIAGEGYYNGELRSFSITVVVPEPGAVALAAPAMLMLARRRR